MPRINLVIPNDLHLKLRIESLQEDIALSDLVSEILSESLNKDLPFKHYTHPNEKRTSIYVDNDMYNKLQFYTAINHTNLTRAVTSLTINNFKKHEEFRQLHTIN
jgi:hypothetical protein